MTGRGKVRHYFKHIFFLVINYSGSEDFLTSLTYSKKNTLLLKKKGFRINPFFSSLHPA